MDSLSKDLDDLNKCPKLTLIDIHKLTELHLSKSYFLYENKCSLLEKSYPIGLSLMVVLSETYLEHLEDKATKPFKPQNPNQTTKSFNCKTQAQKRRSVVFITAAQLHSSKPEIRFCAGYVFRQWNIPQKQFIIITIQIQAKTLKRYVDNSYASFASKLHANTFQEILNK